MDTIRSFRGYGRVTGEDNDDRRVSGKTKRRLAIVVVSFAVVLAVIIPVSISAISTRRPSSSSPPPPPVSFPHRIKSLCAATRYPSACSSSLLAMANTTDMTDEALFALSLRVAMAAISDATNAASSFTIPLNDGRLAAAVRDCEQPLADAAGHLNDSLASLRMHPDMNDLRTWLSAALADHEACLDGFDDTTGSVKDKMASAMVNATTYVSNSLAIAVKTVRNSEKLHHSKIHRKLLALPRILLDRSRLAPNVTVAKDGSGHVGTIREAIGMVPTESEQPFVIYVKEGVYRENVVVGRDLWNVVVIGDGMYKSIVDGRLNFVDGTPTFSTATFGEWFLKL